MPLQKAAHRLVAMAAEDPLARPLSRSMAKAARAAGRLDGRLRARRSRGGQGAFQMKETVVMKGLGRHGKRVQGVQDSRGQAEDCRSAAPVIRPDRSMTSLKLGLTLQISSHLSIAAPSCLCFDKSQFHSYVNREG
jgi:hypothetical protein